MRPEDADRNRSPEDAPRGDHGASPRMWRRLEATLVYDSRLGPRASGLRGLTTTFPRLLYTAGGFEVDLQIRPCSTAGRLRLVGQVLNQEFEPCSGCVRIDGAFGATEADLDGCGHFSIGDLTSSGHRLEIVLPDALIEVPVLYL